MNDNNFFTVNVKPQEHPLEYMKMLHAKYVQENPGGPEVVNIQKFIDFVEKEIPMGALDYLLFSNSGQSQTSAGLILINLGTSQKLAPDLVPELYHNLYDVSKVIQPPMDDVYFNYTRISGVWEWWEKGITREEPFGTVNEDKLIGFVRVRLQ
jgi:hypothetical protein